MIGSLGGWFASLIGFPSAWLLGAMLTVLAANVLGAKVHMPSSSTTFISWILGISLSSGFDLAIIEHISLWSGSLFLMFLMLIVSLGILHYFYTHICGWNPKESLLASVPGNLNVVLIFAAQENVDAKRIAMVHTLRIFAIVFSLPLLFPIVDRVSNAGLSFNNDIQELILVVISSGIIGEVARRIKVPAGMLLGSLASALFFKFYFNIQIVISPAWFHLLLIVLGTYSAVRMSGVNLGLLIQSVKSGLGGVALTLLVSFVFSLVLYASSDISLLQALLSYLPGGIEVAIAIAFSTNVDPVFVATHQVLRVVLMSLLLPVVYQFVKSDLFSKN